MNNKTLEPLFESYQGIATSTLGHLTDEGYLPTVKAIHRCSAPLVGRVLTVKLHSGNTEVIKQALIEAEPSDVLCIDAQILGDKACWGALRTCAAIYEKLTAVIILGSVTDSIELEQLNFPVFATGLSSVTTFKSDSAMGSLNKDIHYQRGQESVTIRSGDLALMDNDGVFVLPPELAQQLQQPCRNKHDEDTTKLQMFIQAYKANKLDQLLSKG